MYSAQGKRCLLLARKVLKKGTLPGKSGTTQHENAIVEWAKSVLTLIGVVAIVDPLRPDTKVVVSDLRGAGIRIATVCAFYSVLLEGSH
jgi:sodium/potassium-transporting ATPase subunit alpha